MVAVYLIATTSFAALCSLCWMLWGGGVLGAVGVYLAVGQVTMLSLIALAACRIAFRARRETA